MELAVKKKKSRAARSPEERRAFWDRLKADPIRWAAYQDRAKIKRRAKYLADPDYFHSRTKAWAAKHPDRAKAAQLKSESKRDKVKKAATTRAWFKKKYESDPVFRAKVYMRNRIRDLVRGITSTSACMEMVGCTPEVFKIHIENQFQPGMSWDKYGYETWHIDHKRPIATYDLKDEDQRRKAFHYSNLQPLWADENFRKSKFRIPDECLEEIQLGLPLN